MDQHIGNAYFSNTGYWLMETRTKTNLRRGEKIDQFNKKTGKED